VGGAEVGPISLFFGLVIILILFGIVLLVAGGLWTLVFMCLRRRRRARLAVLIAGGVLTLALMGLFLAGLCGFLADLLGLRPVSERSMVGTWVVHYRTDNDGRPAGTDTLILKPDHTFIQICLPEKGKKIEATIGRRPVRKYDKVRMVGTWHIVGDRANHLEIEGALGPPRDGIVAGNPFIRYGPSGFYVGGMPIEWGGILARGDSDTDDADYFRKVK
jgi:hypothetical protein